jgi:uncharacterized protein (TIGR00730 family)
MHEAFLSMKENILFSDTPIFVHDFGEVFALAINLKTTYSRHTFLCIMVIKKICVYCGASAGADPVYLEKAQALANMMVAHQIGLVYGGGNVGLMGSIADAVMGAGGHVTGIMPEFLVKREIAHRSLSEMHIVDSMHSRKALMSQLSDAFIAMPGGIGTLEEILEVATWHQLGIQLKPCGFLNVNGFYDHFIAFLDKMVEQGFFSEAHRGQIFFEDEPEALLAHMKLYEPKFISKSYVLPKIPQ